MVRLLLYFAAATTLLCDSLGAQHTVGDSSTVSRTGASSGEIWAGYSPGSTTAGFLGQHGGISLGLVGMRLNHRIRRAETRLVYYTFDLIPVARVTPIIVYGGDAATHCQPPKFDCRRASDIARGIGFTPLGLTAIYRPDRALQWRFGANGGVLIFDRRTPSDMASQFNFTAAIECGMQLVKRNGTGMLLVYRLHHLSNGGQAEDNLAILSHVISIGARWRLGR